MSLINSSSNEVLWKICNFNKNRGFKIRNFERYAYFLVGNKETLWEFKLFVDHLIILSINCDSKLNDNELKLELYMLSQEKRHFVGRFTESKTSKNSFSILIPSNHIFNRFKSFIKNDVLNLSIKMDYIHKGATSNVTSDVKNLAPKFQDFFDTKIFADFTFICSDGKEIPAHRVIIAANSPVFLTMLSIPMNEAKTQKVKIDDIDGETMEEILRFIYTDKVNNIDQLAPKILYAADKYELDKLKKLCIESMMESLSVENALEYFVLAGRYKYEILKKSCLVFIDSNYHELREQRNWENLNKEELWIIMDYLKKCVKYTQEFVVELQDAGDSHKA